MQFSIKTVSPEAAKTGCVIVGVHEGRKLSPAGRTLDRAALGALRDVLNSGDMEGKPGTTRLLYAIPGTSADRILLVGLGNAPSLQPKSYREVVRAAVSALSDTGARDAIAYFSEIAVSGKNDAWKARQFAQIAAEVLYRFDAMKSRKPAACNLASLALGVTSRSRVKMSEAGILQGKAVAAGMTLARDMGNLPGNVCTPSHLASEALRLAREWKLDCEVLEKKDMERLGMGALLSVARGSTQPPKFIVLQYRGAAKKEKPVVLIGKGITFDTGGISLKPGAEMDEMKFDMCGAASVLGTMRAVAELKLKLNIVGIMPATENMPDGAASKPGDIVTSMSGQTIEILNTDAEGRLILADALTYAERFEPQAVVDIATLTGACVIALGHVCSGVFSSKDALAREIIEAGENAWDRAWRLPLWDDYQEQLKSNFADMANIGGRAAGSVTAACFLSRYARNFDWAHLDIAGVAWRSGKDKGATGRPVPLLTSFLMRRAGRK